MKSIHILLKPASGLCNLRCKYCFYIDEMGKREQSFRGMMSEETLEEIIVKGMETAEREITFAFQGGEPTLRGIDFFKRAVELQKFHNKKGLKIYNALQTNGYVITGEWCQFFRENHFLIGLSIDGTKKTHDANRMEISGGGSYLKCIQTAELFQSNQVDFNILTVINKQNVSKIRKIYQDYLKRGFYYQQYIACLDPLFQERGTQEYSLMPQMYGDFLVELFQLWYDDVLLGKQPYIRQFENYIGILAGHAPESCEQNGICSFQNVIEADGSVYPCDFYVLDEYYLGNIKEQTFEQMKQRQIDLQFVEKSANHSSECLTCDYFKVCRGGCNRHRIYNKEKDIYENYFCKSYMQLFDHYYEKMYQLSKHLKA